MKQNTWIYIVGGVIALVVGVITITTILDTKHPKTPQEEIKVLFDEVLENGIAGDDQVDAALLEKLLRAHRNLDEIAMETDFGDPLNTMLKMLRINGNLHYAAVDPSDDTRSYTMILFEGTTYVKLHATGTWTIPPDELNIDDYENAEKLYDSMTGLPVAKTTYAGTEICDFTDNPCQRFDLVTDDGTIYHPLFDADGLLREMDEETDVGSVITLYFSYENLEPISPPPADEIVPWDGYFNLAPTTDPLLDTDATPFSEEALRAFFREYIGDEVDTMPAPELQEMLNNLENLMLEKRAE
jgi:hypothetical protein